MEAAKTAKPQCPHCKQNIVKNDIRPVLPINLSIQDVVEEEKIKRDLNQAKLQLANYNNQLEKTLLALSMTKRELNRIIKNNNGVSDQEFIDKDHSNTINDNYKPINHTKSFQLYRTEYLTNKNLSTYAMAIHEEKKIIFTSTKKDKDYGVNITSIQSVDHEPFLPIHSGVIRDIKCQRDYLLTSGYDKTMKLTSIKDKKLIETFPLNSPGYCCLFDINDSSPLLYCGLANGSVIVYDKRQSKSPLCQLNNRQLTGTSPVHSIAVIKINDKPVILCANLNKFYAWQLDPSNLTQPLDGIVPPYDECSQCHILTLDSMQDFKPYSLSMNENDQTLLLSLRRHNSSKHMIMRLLDDFSLEKEWSLEYPSEQKWINHTLEFKQGDKSILCFSDGVKNNFCLQDNDGQLKSFSIGERIYDIQHSVLDNHEHLITILTSSKIQLYKYF
ncbi:unnamed protein product [Cunninghamella echinulata]